MAAKAKTPKKSRTATAKNARQSRVHHHVLFLFREFFCREAPPMTDAEILATDPNEWDMDPSPFYAQIDAVFDVPDLKANCSGYGGKVASTIA